MFSLQTAGHWELRTRSFKFEELHDFGNGCRFQTAVKSFSAFMKLHTGISTRAYSKTYLAVAWRTRHQLQDHERLSFSCLATVRRSRPVSSDILGNAQVHAQVVLLFSISIRTLRADLWCIRGTIHLEKDSWNKPVAILTPIGRTQVDSKLCVREILLHARRTCECERRNRRMGAGPEKSKII